MQEAYLHQLRENWAEKDEGKKKTGFDTGAPLRGNDRGSAVVGGRDDERERE